MDSGPVMSAHFEAGTSANVLVQVHPEVQKKDDWYFNLARMLEHALPGATVSDQPAHGYRLIQEADLPVDLVICKGAIDTQHWRDINEGAINKLLTELPQTTFLGMADSPQDPFCHVVLCSLPVTKRDLDAVRRTGDVVNAVGYLGPAKAHGERAIMVSAASADGTRVASSVLRPKLVAALSLPQF